MNDYVVTLNGKKNSIKVINGHTVINGTEEISVELLEINPHLYLLKMGNSIYEIAVNKTDKEKYTFLIDGFYFETIVRTQLQEKAKELLNNKEHSSHHDVIKAPMPGLILKVKKKVGEHIEIGESIVILEAMKMENDIRSPASGIIKEITVKEGNSVEKDEIILKIE